MPEYRVNFRAVANMSVTVDAVDEESALDAAYDVIPSDVCVQCSGWGKPWSLDLGEWETSDQKWPEMAGYPAVEPAES